jgi:hypothetical protein
MRTQIAIAALALTLSALPAIAKEPAGATVGTGHMQHCPTAVEGAKTEIKEGRDSIEITVTAKDAAKTAEIRQRAKHCAEAAKTEPTSVEHTGTGHGGGGLGLCEVVLKDTVVTATDIEGGSKITVKPSKPVDFEWLKKETASRHAANTKKGAPSKAQK